MRDHYKTLGVPRDADPQRIRKAFRELAKRCHPDHSGGGSEPFRRVSQAYQVLMDPRARARHDRHLADKEGLSGFCASGGGAATVFHGAGASPVMDWSPMAAAGLLRLSVSLSRQEAQAGARVPVEVPTLRICARCKGMGWLTGCTRCGGSGKIRGKQTLHLDIPPGVQDGAAFRFHLGRPGSQGLAVWVSVFVESHNNSC